MAVEASDIKLRLSLPSAMAGDVSPSTTAQSLGGYLSISDMANNSLNNLFRTITRQESQVGITLYRCFFVVNDGADPWTDVEAWIESQDAFGGDYAIGIDPAGVVARDSSSAMATTAASGTTAPSGVTFSEPDNESRLSIGTIDADECAAIWVRYLVAVDPEAADPDKTTMQFAGLPI